MKNNSLFILCLFGFLSIIIVAKIISEKDVKSAPEIIQPQTPVQQQAPVQQPPVIIQPTAPIIVEPVYPKIYSDYHNKDLFWRGYSDGFNGFAMSCNYPEYFRGYEVGVHDRHYRKPYYYDRYCPPGFSVRIPGFSLNIR